MRFPRSTHGRVSALILILILILILDRILGRVCELVSTLQMLLLASLRLGRRLIIICPTGSGSGQKVMSDGFSCRALTIRAVFSRTISFLTLCLKKAGRGALQGERCLLIGTEWKTSVHPRFIFGKKIIQYLVPLQIY